MNSSKQLLLQVDRVGHGYDQRPHNSRIHPLGIAQPKVANSVPIKKTPVGPPVYRPQPAPKVLQEKKRFPQHQAHPLKAAIAQSKTASAVRKSPVAPPVYRPQVTTRNVQPKSAEPRPSPAHPKLVAARQANSALSRQQRMFAPGAREVTPKTVAPKQASGVHVMRKPSGSALCPGQTGTNNLLPVRTQPARRPRAGRAIRQPVAPPVYRCQPLFKALQTRTHNRFHQGRVRVAAPTRNPAKPGFSGAIIQPSIHPGRPDRARSSTLRGVIQARGKLKVIKTAEIKEESEIRDLVKNYRRSRYVDMEWRGVTNGTPLYSDSFANCLGVVIHNQERDYGALMHLFPAVIGGTDTQTLFYAVNKELKKIVAWNSYTGGNLELLLWKGISWAPGQNKKLEETGQSYAEYLGRKHHDKFVNIIDLMDKELITADSTAMLYVPKNGTVYLVDRDTEAILHEIKRDSRSVEDADFAKIEHKMPGYYEKKQRLKQAKRERIGMFISQLETKSIEELQKILKENYGSEQSEEKERAAIYLLEKKQHPGFEPRPPRIQVSERDLQRFM